MQRTIIMLMCLVAAMNANAQSSTPREAPTNLRCEFLVDPLGIDQTQPRLSWELNDPRRGAVQNAYQILVADSPAKLAAAEGNLWDSTRIESDQTFNVVYAGQPLKARQQVWWQVRVWDADSKVSAWSAPATFSIGLLNADDWRAQWIRSTQPEPEDRNQPITPPRLRKSFQLDANRKIARATVYVTALGLYELHINGQVIGDHKLAPEFTDYHKRVQYQTFDVTDTLQANENVVAAQLADGWYAGHIGLTQVVPNGPTRGIYGRKPKFLLQLEVEYADGQTERIVTDRSWKYSAEGPQRSADLLDGETIDARRAMPGWDQPGFADTGWKSVAIETPSAAELVAQPNEPIRITQTLKPIKITTHQPGVYIVDMGQNMVGWCRLSAQGAAGTEIKLRHAEVLNPDGSLYTDNLRSAQATDRFILAGDGVETFEPRFTYHGFRFVEITGLDQQPSLDDITGCVVHSDCREVGTFECSQPLLNKIWTNVLWTQRDNMHSIPTDCPQRDERLGWTGDILAFAQTACFNMDMAAFYTKWMHDMVDDQASDGRFPDFAPQPYDSDVRFSGVPAWGDAGVFVPWVAYRNYGDVRILEVNYTACKRWVDWIHSNNPDYLWKNKRHNDYGDWLNADTLKLEGWPAKGAEMPKEVFATAFFFRSTEYVSKMAHVLGKADDAKQYGELAEHIRAAFNKAYLKSDGLLEGDTQAGYAIALRFDLLPDAQRNAAAERMVKCFDRYDGQISTGFHSTICLMRELTRWGHNEAAYKLISNRKMPSWGYAIDHGATTQWERWDGYVEGRGFQDPGMNSFAHYALGSVAEWMYRTMIGINPDPEIPAYKQILIRPQPGGGVVWVKGSYDSIRGKIASEWRIANGKITLKATIPPNTTALIYVPTSDRSSVTEGGQPVANLEDIITAPRVQDAVVVKVPAGTYQFEAAYQK